MSSLLDSADVATKLRTSRRQVTILCARGDLRAMKVGRQWLVDPADLQTYLDGLANRTRRQRRRRAA